MTDEMLVERTLSRSMCFAVPVRSSRRWLDESTQKCKRMRCLIFNFACIASRTCETVSGGVVCQGITEKVSNTSAVTVVQALVPEQQLDCGMVEFRPDYTGKREDGHTGTLANR